MKSLKLAAMGVLAAAGLGLAFAAHSEDAKPAQQPLFTAAQAKHGGDLYLDHCASCHGPNLNDGGFAPALTGQHFKSEWSGKSAADLYSFIDSNMPPGEAGNLSPDEYSALEAYVLQANGAPPGDKALTADTKSPLF